MMFDTLHDKIGVSVEFRDFDFGDMTALRSLLPIHLCRTIGEANLSENPFATMSLYPFWVGNADGLRLRASDLVG